MSADINIVNGRAAIMTAGPVAPWHNLGQRVDTAQTSEEAIITAGLNYTVSMRNLMTVDGIKLPKDRAVVRDDTQDIFAVVGKDYQPVQNARAFEFMDSLVPDGSIRYETAGALGAGERIWLLAKLPGEIKVVGDDITNKYLLLSNTHNGSGTLRVFFTPIRVVCQNTLTLALRGGQHQGVSIYHRGDVVSKVDEAQKILGLAFKTFDDFETKAHQLVAKRIDDVAAMSYFETLYPKPRDAEDRPRAVTNHTQKMDALTNLFQNGKGTEFSKVRGTMWAAYNAVTEFVDHSPARSKDEAIGSSQRLKNNWFGQGADLKAHALIEALAVAKS
jgi:phage/plasmid-like protein (TIGR03299 family)